MSQEEQKTQSPSSSQNVEQKVDNNSGNIQGVSTLGPVSVIQSAENVTIINYGNQQSDSSENSSIKIDSKPPVNHSNSSSTKPHPTILTTMKQQRNQVFISYSDKDREWLDKLTTMLKPLIRNQTITVWDDTNIQAGSKWKDEIQKALATAKVAVLMVSPNFLDSDFIAEHQLPPLLQAAEQDGLTIIWVCVSACLYEETPIEYYQAAHDKDKPLKSLSEADLDQVLVEICRKIKAAYTSSKSVMNNPETEFFPIVNVEVELKSEKGIDYSELQQLLAQGNWKEANQETADRMLQAISKDRWEDVEELDIEKFPCEDLRTIDQLWVKYSNGKFGFSVQKNIWLEVVGEGDWETEKELGDHVWEMEKELCARVGWYREGKWLPYDSLTFDSSSARIGHLPWVKELIRLFSSRVKNCNL